MSRIWVQLDESVFSVRNGDVESGIVWQGLYVDVRGVFADG